MEIKIGSYMQDGACAAARAVLALISGYNVEDSYNQSRHAYDVDVQVARWDNCREQGYVAYLRVNGKQLNIAFFEHRNSDNICAVKWEQSTFNAPTMGSAEFGDVYKDKYDVSHSVSYNEHYAMKEWIEKQFDEFYKAQKEDS